MTRAVVLVTVAALTGCARGRAGDPASPSSGVRGRTMVDGGCPIQRAERPCPHKPVVATITVTPVGTSRPVAVVVSDAHGRFEVPLLPGRYVVAATQVDRALHPNAPDIQVTVEQGKYPDITIPFDSGIR